jgi:hypothetical protein
MKKSESDISIHERVWRGDRVKVRNPDNGKVFTIQSRELMAIRFFGVVEEGRTRADKKFGYKMLDKNTVENWTRGLELVCVIKEFARVIS